MEAAAPVRVVVVVACGVRHNGTEAVDVDADVVVVHVLELDVLHRVDLGGEEVIRRVAVVVDVGEPHVLCGQRGGEVRAGRDGEGDAVAAEPRVGREDGEREGSREGPHRAAERLAEAHRGPVEGVALELDRAIGELEEAVCRDGRRAVQGEVGGAGEAREDELVLAGGRTNGKSWVQGVEEKDGYKEGDDR